MRVRLLTTGSRGDVQPFVALGVGLKDAGHDVRVVTAANFEGLVRGAGLDIGIISADYEALTQSEEGREIMANPLKAGKYWKSTVVPLQETILRDSWEGAKDADLLVHHPKTLAGIHIAEKLQIPIMLGLLIPAYFPTSEFASPITPQLNLGGVYNRVTHAAFSGLVTLPFKGVINDFRQNVLSLPKARGLIDETTRPNGDPVPALFGYSPSVVPKPGDWPEDAHVTGYWFLDTQTDWQPPEELVRFIEASSPPLYIGFGSMAAEDATRTTRIVLDAIEQSGQRAVIASGWGGLDAVETDPERVHVIEGVPHDWLFPRMAAVVHHGGAGTTAAGLRAGKPTLIVPFSVDQPFWGRRVHALGVGPEPMREKDLTVDELAASLRTLAADQAMCERARQLGEQIRQEDGVQSAVRRIEEYAQGW